LLDWLLPTPQAFGARFAGRANTGEFLMTSTQLEQDFDKLSASVTQACELIDKLRSQRNDLLAIVKLLIPDVPHKPEPHAPGYCALCKAMQILEQIGNQS